METIRNYLNAMFAGLPDTPEVRRAYEELAAMMEDKYSELMEEGMSENEAVGTVISEFGNLDELAQTLGIEDYLKNRSSGVDQSKDESVADQQSADSAAWNNTRVLTVDDVCEYIEAGKYSALLMAMGVFLCITSPVSAVWTGDLGGAIGNFFSSVGIALLFIFVAVAVALFRMSGQVMKSWKFLDKEGCRLEEEAREVALEQEQETARLASSQKTLGIVLCIVSVVPPIIFDSFGSSFGAACMFVLAGAGVFLIVFGSCKKSVCKRLHTAEAKAAARSYAADGPTRVYVRREKKSKYRYENQTLDMLMPVYWEIVTCIYLGWSFLSGSWEISWMIWIIAGIVKKVIKNKYGIPTERA